MFGQALIAILILLGGIGIFVLKVYFINILFGVDLSLSSRTILEKERSSKNLGVTKETIKIAVSVLFITIFISSFILSFLFYFRPGDFSSTNHGINPIGDVGMSIRFGIFHAISAINNAGFDIIGDNSLVPYYKEFSIQIIFIILFILGGIGYPVIYDVFR